MASTIGQIQGAASAGSTYLSVVNARSIPGTLLHEGNWSQITSNLKAYPFRISEIRNIEKEIPLARVSFKYNLQGAETYFNGQEEVSIRAGEYLLATNLRHCEVFIDQKEEDDLGLCVDLDLFHLSEGLQTMYQGNELQPLSQEFRSFLLEEQFFERFRSNPVFDQWIRYVFTALKSGQNLSTEVLQFEFIRQFLFHHSEYLSCYARLPVLRSSSKKALYARMLTARDVLHDHVRSDLSMQDLARQVHLSEYRLYHVFKDTFGVSPHRYLLQLKLNEALVLHGSGNYNWTEIAEQLHFADVQSFSKLFRKHFRMSPSRYTALAGKQQDKL